MCNKLVAGRDGEQSYAHLLYTQQDDRLLYFMNELPLKAKDFKLKHGYSDTDIALVKENLQLQVKEMLELIKQPEGKEWAYILDYFGEHKPMFWEKYGRIIVDTSLFLVLIIIVSASFVIFKV
jgi:superfamily II DNA helicase RecQ